MPERLVECPHTPTCGPGLCSRRDMPLTEHGGIGRRLPDAIIGVSGSGWEAWENDRQPGDYMKVASSSGWPPGERLGDGTVYWYVCDPDGEIGTLIPARHVVTVHEDGTISVMPSILNDGGGRTASERLGGQAPGAIAGPGWHGFLERGVWRSC